MSETTPRTPFTHFLEIRDAVIAGRDKALREARTGCRFVRHSNFRLIGCNDKGRLDSMNEPYYLDLSKFNKKTLKSFSKEVAANGGTYVSIDGSVDGCDELFGEYEPTEVGYCVDVPLAWIAAL